ncbi:MAG TPA: hypothetical protein VFI25_18865 [Planctomycetota bacterium]|jgi:hypothetical protein|nr:hypothetical protein [Planctomycetota bacterium]
MRKSRDLPALLLYAAAAVALYGDSFGGGRSFFPLHSDELPPWSSHASPERLASLRATSVYGLTDKPWAFHPLFVEAGRALRAGELPLWNPRLFCGFPQHAVQLTGLFYPFHLPFLLGDPFRWYGILAAFHAFAAASLTYAFLRRLAVGRAGSALGGFAFGFGGWHLLRAHYPMVAAAGTWLPLALLSIESLARGRGGRWIAAGAAAFALSFSAGFPQVAVLSAELSIAYAVWRFLGLRREARERGAPFALSCVATLLLGALLSAPQVLPGIEFASRAERGDVSVEALRVRALHPAHFLSLLVPDLFGDPVRDKAPVPPATTPPLLAALLVPPTDNAFNVFENGAYLGVFPLLAAFLGLRRRGPPTFFAGAALVFAAFSVASPLLSVGHAILPGFRLGAPSRNLFAVAFCAAVLSGLGLDAVLRDRLPRRRTLAAVLLLVASGWAAGILSLGDAPFAGRRLFTSRPALARVKTLTGVEVTREEVLARYPDDVLGANLNRTRNQATRLFLFLGGALGVLFFARRSRPYWAVGLAAADLLSFGGPLANSVPREGLFDPPALVRPLLERREEGRLFRVGGRFFLAPNLLGFWGVDEAGGYSPSLGPYERFLGLVDPSAPLKGVGASTFAGPDLPRSPLFPLLGIRWLLAPIDVASRWPADRAEILERDGGFALARLREEPLRAFVARRAKRVRDEASAIRRLREADFDPRSEVVLLDPDLPEGEEKMGEGSPVPARIVERSFNRIVVEAPEEGWLVLTDAWYPGWKARTGRGEKREILRADLFFRAVDARKKGERIEFSYEPGSFRWGVGLGVLGILALGATLLRPRLFGSDSA